MSEETGVYTEEARDCLHPERLKLRYTVLCPRCDTSVFLGKDREAAYREILDEIINVQDFDTANVVYLDQLQRTLALLKKLV